MYGHRWFVRAGAAAANQTKLRLCLAGIIKASAEWAAATMLYARCVLSIIEHRRRFVLGAHFQHEKNAFLE